MNRLLTVKEVAERLQVAVDWVYEHSTGGRRPTLPFKKLGKHVRFREEEVDRWVDGPGAQA